MKKSMSILTLGLAAVTMLASCATALTREEALAHLTAMRGQVEVTGYVLPTNVGAEMKATGGFAEEDMVMKYNYSHEYSFVSVKQEITSGADGSVSVSNMWLYVDGANIIAAQEEGPISNPTRSYTSDPGDAEAWNTKVAGRLDQVVSLTTVLTMYTEVFDLIESLADLDETTTLKKESYSKNDEKHFYGEAKVDYTLESSGVAHQTVKAEFVDLLPTLLKMEVSGAETGLYEQIYNWNKAKLDKPDLSKFTKLVA